jgi:hypothetical protein
VEVGLACFFVVTEILRNIRVNETGNLLHAAVRSYEGDVIAGSD